jgi:hypothetical protein
MIKYILPHELSGEEGRPARRAPRGRYPQPSRSPDEFSPGPGPGAGVLAAASLLERPGRAIHAPGLARGRVDAAGARTDGARR